MRLFFKNHKDEKMKRFQNFEISILLLDPIKVDNSRQGRSNIILF